MASYQLECAACGEPFAAAQRNRVTCSKRCGNRLRRSGPYIPDANSKLAHLLAPRAAGSLALFKAPGVPPEFMASSGGRIVAGPRKGTTIGDLARTAADRGFLLFKIREDGEWYSAEWWPEHKTVALCGPCKLPIRSTEMVQAA